MNFEKMLEKEIADSEEFARQNFGAPIGPDFPEIARDCMASEHVCQKVFLRYMMASLSGERAMSRAGNPVSNKDFAAAVAREQSICQGPMEFLYWGIQMGRKMERENASVLAAIEKAETELHAQGKKGSV